MGEPVNIGRYRAIEELGRGGMGVVYRGEDPVLERPVAIKVLPPKRLNQKMVERFLREAKTAARLDSQYIVKIHDIGQVDDIYFIVMELVDGIALSDMIDEDVVPTPAQLSERLSIFRQVLEAVSYAHENEVIHRDLKPDNIMITKKGRVKVMDFGLAFFQGHHSLTEVGQVMGTAAYVSPEQAQGKVTDQRTDIYSLGVILFELITGSWPFTATNPLEMFRKVSEVPPPSPRSINPTISPELEAITLRMLAKKPEERFQNIREILAVYDRAVAGNAQTAPQQSGVPQLGAGQFGVPQSSAGQFGVPQSSAGQFGSAQLGAGQFGSAQLGAGQFGAPQLGVSQQAPDAASSKLAPGEFDAQALLDSIASSSDISELLNPINLDEALADATASPVPTEGSSPTGYPASEAPVGEVRRRPVAPAPGPAMRQVIEQTSVGDGSQPGSGLADLFKQVSTEPRPGAAPQSVAAPSYGSPVAANAAAQSSSGSVPVSSLPPSGSSAAAAPALGAGTLSEAIVEAGGTAAVKAGYVPAQAVSPAQYAVAAGPSAHKSFATAVSSGAVASNSWMANVQEKNEGGRVENILNKLQRQEEDAEKDTAQVSSAERVLYCPKCGAENSGLDKVCSHCGSTLSISQYISQREASNYLAEGKALYEKANYREAVVDLLQAISKDSNSSDAYLYLGRCYLELGEYGEAHSSIERAISLSTDAQPYVALADFYQYTDQPDLVMSALQHALDREPYNVAVGCRLAFVYREAGRIEAAVEQYRQVISSEENNLEANRQLGFILSDLRRYDEAIACLEKVCYLDPRDSNAYELLARLYLQTGRVNQAQQTLRNALQYDDGNASLHSELATLYLSQNQGQQALDELNASLELDPGNAEASLRMADLLCKHGQAGEAVMRLEQALQSHPQDAQIHRQLGEIYMSAGHLEKALDHFEALVALDPRSAELYSRLGRIYQKKHYDAESINAYQKAVELHPVNAEHREDLAMAYYEAGQLQAAAQEFAKAARLDYTNPSYSKALGIIMYDMGQYDEARRQLVQSLENNNKDPQALGILGKALVAQGFNSAAVSVFQHAMELAPQWYFLNLPLARAYSQLGKHEQAIACFQDFMKHANSSTDQGIICRAYVDMGFSYLSLKDYHRATEMFRAVLQRDSSVSEAWRGLAEIALAKKNYDQAQQCLNKGLRVEPRSLKLQMLAADIQGGRGSWSNAISIMQTACEQHPHEPEAFEHLGRALRKGGRLQDAVDLFNQAVQRFPELAGHFMWLRGRVEFRQGQYDAALWSYRQALDMVCDDWRIYVDLGKACVSLQQMNDACDAFTKAMRCAPDPEKKQIKSLMERLNL